MNAKTPRPVLDLTPAGRAVVILASLALGAAWTTGSEPARVAACLLLAPLLTDWVCKLRRFDGVTIRVGKRRTRAGAVLHEEITLQHRGRRALWHVHVSEHGLLASTRGQGAHVEHVPSLGARELELTLRARTRGRASTRMFVLTTHHPFGLVRLSAPVATEARVIAEPARIAWPMPIGDHGRDNEDAHDSVRGRDAEAFYALREVRDGEDFARVHALRSASLGTPVRVVRRGAAQHHVRLLLDLRSPPGRLPHRHQDHAFEWALSAATTLVEQFAHHGRACDVLVLGKNRVSFEGLGDRTPPSAFFEHLASARPHSYAPAPEATLAWLATGAGDVFWIIAGGFAATNERERAGGRVQLLEWVA